MMRIGAGILWVLGAVLACIAVVNGESAELLVVAGLALAGAIVIFLGIEQARGVTLVGAGVGAVVGAFALLASWLANTMCAHCDNFWISLVAWYLIVFFVANGFAAREIRLASSRSQPEEHPAADS